MKTKLSCKLKRGGRYLKYISKEKHTFKLHPFKNTSVNLKSIRRQNRVNETTSYCQSQKYDALVDTSDLNRFIVFQIAVRKHSKQ